MAFSTPAARVVPTIVSIILIVAKIGAVAAWTTTSSSLGNKKIASSSLYAKKSNRDDDHNEHLLLDRRSALREKAAIIASSVMISTLQSQPEEAKAATASTASASASKRIYRPPPDSLVGKVILITGGNTGLGLESAKRLAAAGGTIVLTARTNSKGENALKEVREYLSMSSIENASIYFTTLDLADFESVKAFPKRYKSLLGERKIDVLMNNAGVAAIPEKETTKDGFERTFQTNHLGPFMLTALLFPYLNREKSRIINVSSYAHEFATLTGSTTPGLDVNNLNSEVDYSGLGWPAYCRSKLENILFTQELQRRADEAGLEWLSVVALHPGRVATDIWRTTYFGVDQRAAKRDTSTNVPVGETIQNLISDLFYSSVLPVEEGANTQVMLAAFGEQQTAKGEYFDQNMKQKPLNGFARDTEKAHYLWDVSQQMTGVEFRVN